MLECLVPCCWHYSKRPGNYENMRPGLQKSVIKASLWRFSSWSWWSAAFWSAKAWTFCDASFFCQGGFLCHASPALRDFSPHRTMGNKKVKLSIQKPWKISHIMKVVLTNGVCALLRDNPKLRGVSEWQAGACLACLRP